MKAITHILGKVVDFEGKTYDKLVMNFDSITGRDIKEAKRFFDRVDRPPVSVLSMDIEFGAYIAAKAAKVPAELLDYLAGGDYMAIGQIAINFLLFSGYAPKEAEKITAAREENQPSTD